MTGANNYELLLSKLDKFIRKYYKNILLKGLIYSLATLSAAYILFSVLEFYGRFGQVVRGVFFFSFIALLLGVLAKYIVKPLLGLYHIGKIISHHEASRIIGTHFPDVKDSLLNTLQLKEQSGSSDSQSSLITASINQRIQKLNPIPFEIAIDLKSNVKYLKYLAVPALALVVILFANFRIITDAPERILNYDKHFEKEAPFSFSIENEKLQSVQSQDFPLQLKIEGKELPAEVYVELNGNRYKMSRHSKNTFTYNFKNLQNDFSFYLWADDFYSNEQSFDVLPKPLLTSFEVQLEYPPYTGKKPEKLKNTGDLIVPQGTKVSWRFRTENADQILLAFKDTGISLIPGDKNKFEYVRTFVQDNSYILSVANKEAGSLDSIGYRINVVADAYPNISVEEKRDSLSSKVSYFVGEVTDDYGFRNLAFYYRFTGSNDKSRLGKGYERVPLDIDAGKTRQQFYYVWDLLDKNLQPGDELEYFFEVYDNDRINGPKKARSASKLYKVPTLEEIKQEAKANSEALKDEMKDALDKTKQLAKELKALEKKLLDKKNLNWEDKKQIDELLKKQEELRKQVEELKKNNQLNNIRENEFKEPNPQILEKQQQLEKLFEEVFDDEMKKLMEELRQIMEQNNKDAIKEQLDKMELSEKDLEKQLDRMLEMYKQVDFDKRFEESLEKLEELAEKQEDLAKETEEDKKSADSLAKEQQDLNKEVDSLKKEFDELDELNKELEEENEEFENPEEEMEEISDDMEQGKEELKKKEKEKAAKKQREAAEKMKSVAKKMREKKDKAEEEENTEDYNRLREIMENLVQLSKDQEALMDEMGKINNYNPKYVELVQKQKKLRDDSKMIEDSLQALSKRVPELSSYINRELSKINDNMTKSMDDFAGRYIAMGRTRQQYSMTSMNNLAVMLSDILRNMQEQLQAQGSEGDGECKKPGKGKGSGKGKSGKKGNKGDSKKMKELQKQLGDELKKMKGQMEGGSKPGSSGWAKMAAQQEAIRRMLQQMKEQLESEGKGGAAGELQKTIEEMEKIEKDLVNKRLTPETIKRHQDIETRLLEHEKAEQEREQDEKRESNEGRQEERKLPPALEEYLKQKEKESELLKNLPPELKPYFKEKTKDYFRNVNE